MTKLITLTSTKDVLLGGMYRMTSLKGVITLEGKVVGKVVMDAFRRRDQEPTPVFRYEIEVAQASLEEAK